MNFNVGKVACLPAVGSYLQDSIMSEMERKLPGNRYEFTRALVEVLDGRGYHNLAFAIMKCVNDDSENPLKHRELEGLVELSKRFLDEDRAASM